MEEHKALSLEAPPPSNSKLDVCSWTQTSKRSEMTEKQIAYSDLCIEKKPGAKQKTNKPAAA